MGSGAGAGGGGGDTILSPFSVTMSLLKSFHLNGECLVGIQRGKGLSKPTKRLKRHKACETSHSWRYFLAACKGVERNQELVGAFTDQLLVQTSESTMSLGLCGLMGAPWKSSEKKLRSWGNSFILYLPCMFCIFAGCPSRGQGYRESETIPGVSPPLRALKPSIQAVLLNGVEPEQIQEEPRTNEF